ncbi:MAG: starch-binding protein [Prevotella sp.]|nr:starch-binding protein [Prevotella sp.]
MRRLLLIIICAHLFVTAGRAQGWPSEYDGVMLQAFYWDGYDDAQWTALEQQADQVSGTFDLVWLPQSGNCGGKSMGYDDLYWLSNYNSSFGTEAQLRSLISTYKAKGIKTLADVVINHRRNVSNWVDFPKETYKGVTYEMKSTDICADDEAKDWAKKNGYKLSSNNDTGEGWDGMRDLDHKSENVQTIVKAYLDFLKTDLGYAGFRYDMVKGYGAQFIGQYNSAAQPEFSVGECWDSSNTIKNWIEGTSMDGIIESAAFDFQFRYTVRNAMNNGDYRYLDLQNDGNWPLVSANFEQGQYRRYAVTFVENHDTERRPNAEQDPLKKDTLAANAFMLAMPGTPCVFMKHWQAYPAEIKAMVAARKAAGVNSESSYEVVGSAKKHFATKIKTASADRLLVVVGDVAAYEAANPLQQWVKVLSGYHYAYYFPVTMDMVYVDLPSGTYEGRQHATLTAVTTAADAQIVYTTDGTTPTVDSPAVDSGTSLMLPFGTTTLTVGLLVRGEVSGVVSRTYTVIEREEEIVITIPSFCEVGEDETCAFFEAPTSWDKTVMCWAWDTQNYTGGKWPGQACMRLGNADNGRAVWKWTYTGTLTTSPTNIIFSNNGSPQTDNLSFVNGGYYTMDGQKGVVPVGVPTPEKCATPTITYVGGKLLLQCATEGAECVWTLRSMTVSSGRGSSVTVAPQYLMSVYATADGYTDSETATALLVWGDAVVEGDNVIRMGGSASDGDVNGDGQVGIGDIVAITNIMAGK